jgi:hypothetical protein
MTSLSVELVAYLKCAFDPPAAAVSAIAILGIHVARGAHEVLMRRAQ